MKFAQGVAIHLVILAIASLSAPMHVVASDVDTSLIKAVEQGDIARVKRLLKEGADVDAGEFSFEGPVLIRAVERGFSEIVRILIEKGADVNIKHHGKRPIHKAATNGYANIISLLLSAGADVNDAYDKGETPLLIAASGGYLEAVKILLAAGAKVDACNGAGENALWKTTFNCEGGDRYVKIARELINAGIDINAKDYSLGHTPLMNAAIRGNVSMAKVLVEAGAKLNEKNRDGYTALIIGGNYAGRKMAKYLRAVGGK